MCMTAFCSYPDCPGQHVLLCLDPACLNGPITRRRVPSSAPAIVPPQTVPRLSVSAVPRLSVSAVPRLSVSAVPPAPADTFVRFGVAGLSLYTRPLADRLVHELGNCSRPLWRIAYRLRRLVPLTPRQRRAARRRAEIIELMNRCREKTRGVTGVDDEIDRIRGDHS